MNEDLSRSTVAALTGAALAVAAMVAFLVVDKATLHWYAPDVEATNREIDALQSDLNSVVEVIIEREDETSNRLDDAEFGVDDLWGQVDDLYSQLSAELEVVYGRLDDLERCVYGGGMPVYVYDIDLVYGEGFGETEGC